MYPLCPQLGNLNSNVTSSSQVSSSTQWKTAPCLRRFPSHHTVLFLLWHFVLTGYFFVLYKGKDSAHLSITILIAPEQLAQMITRTSCAAPTQGLRYHVMVPEESWAWCLSPALSRLRRTEAEVGEGTGCHSALSRLKAMSQINRRRFLF